jgi:Ca-activated chloride channel homolog
VRSTLPVLLVALASAFQPAAAQTPQEPRQVFRASVQRVALSANVRTRQGRPVTDLTAKDFTLIDSGAERKILDFKTDDSPVNLALLVDFSGSMGLSAKRQSARDNAFHILSWLQAGRDEAGLYVFDKSLRELQALAPAPGNILAQLDGVRQPYGATSLFDAIAETGRLLSSRAGTRRAVVALTDGADNASQLTAEQVSAIASGIDVPVYVVVVVSPFDRSEQTTIDDPRLIEQVLQGPLANLARWTGGEIYLGIGPAQSSNAARQIVTDLRTQYLIAFEPDGRPGWHPIELRTRDKDHVVRARSGYLVGSQQ